MHTFIEAWTPNDTWTALSEVERRRFMDGVRGAMAQIAEQGVVTLGWGRNEDDVPKRVERTYVAIWRAPSAEAIAALEAGIAASGWYDYFDQVNLRARLHPADTVIDELIAQ